MSDSIVIDKEALRDGITRIAEAIMPKSITPDMVAGVMSSLADWLQAIEEATTTIPTPQATRDGSSREYIHAVNDPQSKMSVLNAPDTFVRQNAGHLMMQKGLWNPENASIYYSRNNIPGASTSADGVLTKEVFNRLGTGAVIHQETATLSTVVISYPNWATGGARTFTISPATSAAAGVMTSADKKKLDSLPAIQSGAHVIYTDEDGDNDNTAVLVAGGCGTEHVYGDLHLLLGGWTSDPENSTVATRIPLPAATTTGNGVMSAADKRIVDALGSGVIVREFANVADAAGFAGSATFSQNPSARVLLFRCGSNLHNCGVIIQQRWEGMTYQYMFAENKWRVRGVNGSNVYAWEMCAPRSMVFENGTLILRDYCNNEVSRVSGLVAAEAGKGLSSHDFNSQWLTRLSHAGVYGREANTLRAVNGVFSLRSDATDEQIKATLTEYLSKNVLTREDLEYCAAHNCALWDEQTQGFVSVTCNGGGYFNLLELSQANYGELPRLRMVGLLARTDGTFAVTRAGQEERLAFKSELDAVMTRLTAIEKTLNPDNNQA